MLTSGEGAGDACQRYGHPETEGPTLPERCGDEGVRVHEGRAVEEDW